MNFGDLFDSPWKILIIAIVALVFFGGAAKLPVFARSLGRSMRILKSEVSKLHDDDEEQAPKAVAEAVPQAQPLPSAQQQIEQLQQQVRDLQSQTSAVNGAAVTETQPTNQPR